MPERNIDPDNSVRAIMTKSENCEGVCRMGMGMGESDFRYVQYGPTPELAEEGCINFREGMISASKQIIKDYPHEWGTRGLNAPFRAFQAEDFSIKFERSYLDETVETGISWTEIITETPVSIEQREVVGAAA